MRVLIGSDHAGADLRALLAEYLRTHGYEVIDQGGVRDQVCDFPDVAADIANRLGLNPGARAILICGSGVGMCMAANRVAGVRAALAHDVYSAHQSVEHDDANVLCLGARVIGIGLAQDLVEAFLHARFDDRPDFVRRLAKLAALERR